MRFGEYIKQVQAREHVYPPLELYLPLPREKIAAAWEVNGDHPTGIYLHIPFCEQRCRFCYCDTIVKGTAEHEPYVKALVAEMQSMAASLSGKIHTVYFGGGTPSALGEEHLETIFDALARNFRFADQVHFNFEATPSSISAGKAKILERAKVNRVTLGIQSADPEILAHLERSQSFGQIERAVQLLRQAGVQYINFDLIAGLPNDKMASFEANLGRLLALEPDMVHIYPFSERGGLKPSLEKEQIQRVGQQMLEANGWGPTKNDGFGKSEKARNIQVVQKIEEAASTLGLGVGSRSHVFCQLAYQSRGYRAYIQAKGHPDYLGLTLTRRVQIQKYLMDNLKQGLEPANFARLFGIPVIPVLERFYPHALPLLEQRGSTLVLEESYRAGHAANALFFDQRYEQRLFSHFVGQPQGWPSERISQATKSKELTPDLNWCRFLALNLTRSNVYPPVLQKKPISHQEVFDAWARLNENPPDKLGIYIHVPYCTTKCSFCYCYSKAQAKPDELEAYTKALQRQMVSLRDATKDGRFNTVYLGGGTPSILSPNQLDALFTTMFDSFDMAPGFQFNFEGTPQTLAQGRLEVLAKHSVNRLTVGIQSLDPKVLSAISRAEQGPEEVEKLLKRARQAEMALNIDLVAGLPEQSFSSFVNDLQTVLRWRPDVLHVYPFSNTAETVLYRRGWRYTEEQATERSKMMRYANEELRRAGYLEVQNEAFCLDASARNIQETDKIEYCSSVMGFGYAARSHVFGQASYGTDAAKYRQYMAEPANNEIYWGELLSLDDDMEKFLLSNLASYIDRIRFHDLFGEEVLERFWPQFLWLHQRGLVDIGRTRIKSKIRRSVDHIVFAKLFFNQKYHQELRHHFTNAYDPTEDYEQPLLRSVDPNF
ncbi:MAG: radical SAM protein [Proteobacteria bacterium]|jgi:oxygen-independent coproporphyrinogen III oxidase|nr:radical SAM protein [Pseudomonadota bacterium]